MKTFLFSILLLIQSAILIAQSENDSTYLISGRVFNVTEQEFVANDTVFLSMAMTKLFTVTNDSGYYEFNVQFIRSVVSQNDALLIVKSCTDRWIETRFTVNGIASNVFDGVDIYVCEPDEIPNPFSAELTPTPGFPNSYELEINSSEIEFALAEVDGSSSFYYGDLMGLDIPLFIPQKGMYKLNIMAEMLSGDTLWYSDWHFVDILPHQVPCYEIEPFISSLNDDQSINCRVYPLDINTGIVWNMGNEASITSSSFSYSFEESGMQNICLTVSFQNVCSFEECEEIYIHDSLELCEADFIGTLGGPTNNLVSLNIIAPAPTLNGSLSGLESDDFSTKFTMNGVTIQEQNYWTDFSEYVPLIGTHEFCAITKRTECRDTFCSTLSILPPTQIPSDCTPTFVRSSPLGIQKNEVSFHTLFTANNFNWDFGDGTTSNSPTSITHQYAQSGTYNACLTTTLNGCTATKCDTFSISVFDSCQDTFIVTKFSENRIRYFKPWVCNSGNCIEPIQWDFGDGNTVENSSGYHNFDQGGTYNVCCEIELPGICDTLSCKAVDLSYGDFTFQGTLSGLTEGADYSEGYLVLYEAVYDATLISKIINNYEQAVLVSRDTIQSASDGSFSFDSLFSGSYTFCYYPSEAMQAEGFVPTYLGGRSIWSQAFYTTLIPSYFTFTVVPPTTILKETDLSGPCAIYGNINIGPFRLLNDSAHFVQNARVILYRGSTIINDAPIENNLAYSFTNLPYGLYTLKLDLINSRSRVVYILLTPDAPTADTTITFELLQDLDFTSNINSIEPENSLKLYPNPANEKISIEFISNESEVIHVQIVDLIGRPHTSSSFNHTEKFFQVDLPTDQLSSGLYLCIIRNSNGELLGKKRFVISK
jgi:PKD repeat protein